MSKGDRDCNSDPNGLHMNVRGMKFYTSVFLFVLIFTFLFLPSIAYAQSATLMLQVRTENLAGGEIAGYYTVLYQGGSAISSGFSPATFSLVSSQSYLVEVHDYGSFGFDHWKDTNSKSRDRTVSIGSSTQIVAVYRNVNEPTPTTPPPPSDISTAYSLSVKSEDSVGKQIDGYYTTLSQGSTVVKTGFTTAVFTVMGGESYTVAVQDYGSYAFDHWKDSGSKSRDRSVSVTSNTQIIAVYRNINGEPTPDPTPPPTPTPGPQPTGQSSLTVTTFDSANNQINGYYTTLSRAGNPLITGFSPAKFTLDNGQTYTVAVQDYGSYAFDHWKDTGSKTRNRSVSITFDTLIIAIYRNINDPNPPPPDPTPVPDPTPEPTPNPSPGSISKVKSGLVAKDSLVNGNYDSSQLEANNPNRWIYYGSAIAQNAPVSYSMDTTKGLYLGVKGVASGQWAGFFAVTPDLDAQLYHAVLTIPYTSVKDNSFNTGLYVQTANGLINYVTCVAGVTPSGIVWAIVRTTGNTEQATQFETLWTDSTSKLQTRDCTIITNGDNFLQVYMDGTIVYASSSLKLQMPQPFNAFLEVQTSTASEMLTATYKDYYATMGSKVSVASAPAGSTVKIMQGTTLLASGTANANGIADIDVGKHHFPIIASIQVVGKDNKMVASTGSDISIWGGDAYSMSGVQSSLAQTSQSTLEATSIRVSSLSALDNDTGFTPSKLNENMHILPDSVFEDKKNAK